MTKKFNKLVLIPVLLIGIILSAIFIINNNSKQEYNNVAKEQLDPREVQRGTTYELQGITNNHPVIYIGELKNLTAILPDGVDASTVTWSCTNVSTATCSGTGTTVNVRCIGSGDTKLRAYINNVQQTEFTVTVQPGTITVTSAAHPVIVVGGTYTITFEYSPVIARPTCSSGSPAIATVNKDTCVVTGIGVGDTKITISGARLTPVEVPVTVQPRVAATSVSVNPTSLSLEVNKTGTLTATVKPDNATDKTVVWSSADETIATVNSSGVVTGKKAGTTKITATVKDTTIKKEVPVTVYTNMTTLVLSKSAETLAVGQTDTLTYSFLPSTATSTGVTWSSSDETVATVDQNGVVTAKKVGKATITAKAKTGTAQASCEYTVIEKQVVKITKITIEAKTKKVTVGKTIQLKAIVEPENATEGVVWSSSDESILTVDQTGKVTGVKAGKAKVTASNSDGTIKDSVTITVVSSGSGGGNPGTGAAISVVTLVSLSLVSLFLVKYSKKYQRTHKMIHKI